jgi:mono/diheme cytochrome c family protein
MTGDFREDAFMVENIAAKDAFAAVGLFGSAQALVDAIPRVRGRTAGKLEAYTPYPVHGIEAALGLRRSPLGGMVLVMGLIGGAAAIAFQGWTSAVDYPVVTGGKVPFSWQAFVPILFEITVLFATFTAGLGMLLLLNRLPFFGHPMLRSKAIAGVTRDRFALAIERDPKGGELDVEAARAALLDAGAESVEVLPLPERAPPASPQALLRAAAGVAAACMVAGLATYWGVKLFPVLPPMVRMLDQPRLSVQRESAFFADGSGMRAPPAGTVARGHIPYPFTNGEDAAVLANPLPRTVESFRKGKEVYNVRCALCHGPTGDGTRDGRPPLGSAFGAKPANLLSDQIREYPDGKIYHAIAAGKSTMPAYEAELGEDERWAAVLYVRVLQRAQNAKDEDLER